MKKMRTLNLLFVFLLCKSLLVYGCDDGNCVSCPTSDSVCEGCDAYFFIDASNGCTGCPTNCHECEDADTCKTDKCDTGYTLNANGQCDINCAAHCTTCSTPGTCSDCNEYYFVDANVCSECVSNCKECPNAATCTTCDTGYFVNPSATNPNTCSACPANCNSCSDANTCNPNSCATGYTLSSGRCVPNCAANCASCTTPGTCSTCNAHYFVDSSQTCSGCPSHCNTCTAANTCTQTGCDTTYSFSSGSCVPNCASNCESCETPNTCSVCKTNYILNEASKKCEFYSDGAGSGVGQIHITCSLHCTSCTSSTSCQSCTDGYALTNAACFSCPGGSYAEDSICKPCPTGCSECVSGTECKKGSGNVAPIVAGIVGGSLALAAIIVFAIKKQAILGFKAKSAQYQLTTNGAHTPKYGYA